MEKGCDANPEMKALKEKNADEHKAVCTKIREDGAFVESGENDNLIVQKLVANPDSVGVFGFSFLEENLDKLRDVAIDGVEANYDTISSFQYPGAARSISTSRARTSARFPGSRSSWRNMPAPGVRTATSSGAG